MIPVLHFTQFARGVSTEISSEFLNYDYMRQIAASTASWYPLLNNYEDTSYTYTLYVAMKPYSTWEQNYVEYFYTCCFCYKGRSRILRITVPHVSAELRFQISLCRGNTSL